MSDKKSHEIVHKHAVPSEIDASGQVAQSAAVARRTKELGPSIGRRLRQAREASGLTMRELAEQAHVARKTVQDISNGDGGNVGVGTITDLARALGVSPAWLAFGEGQGPEGRE